MKEHHFIVSEAETFGIREAIILYNIRYWLDKNVANESNIRENRVWTYNSYSAFAELFPYLTESQIKRALQNLVDRGILLKGNFNRTSMDRTNWYSINEEKYDLSNLTDETNLSYRVDKSGRRVDKSGQPIPDSKPQIKNDTIEYNKYVEAWNELHGTKYRLTESKRRQIRARLKTFTPQEIGVAIMNRFDDYWLNTKGADYKGDWNAFWRNDEKVERYLNREPQLKSQEEVLPF